MYCSNCGYQNPDDSQFCASCGASLGAASEGQQSAKSPLLGLIIIAGGVIMMLITMGLDWYTVKNSGSVNLSFYDLVTEKYLHLNYAGTALPLICIMFFSAIVLISLLYSFVSGTLLKKLWIWLGSLCLASLVSNFMYLLLETVTEDTGNYVIPNAGWIVAFIGALLVILGSGYASRKVSQFSF